MLIRTIIACAAIAALPAIGGCGGSDSEDSPASNTASIQVGELTARGTVSGVRPMRELFLLAEVTVSVPTGRPLPVMVTPPQFSLILEGGTSRVASVLPGDGFCLGDQQVEPGGSLTCTVGFDINSADVFTGIRFVDPEVADSVVGPTSSSMVPNARPDDSRLMGSLMSSELAVVCGAAPFPAAGMSFTCTAGGFPVDVRTVADAREECRQSLMPVTLDFGEDSCFDLTAFDCTVAEFEACVSFIQGGICALFEDPIEACLCLSEVPTSCR